MASFSQEIPTDHIFPYAYIALLNVREGISFLAHISTPKERETKIPSRDEIALLAAPLPCMCAQ